MPAISPTVPVLDNNGLPFGIYFTVKREHVEREWSVTQITDTHPAPLNQNPNWRSACTSLAFRHSPHRGRSLPCPVPRLCELLMRNIYVWFASRGGWCVCTEYPSSNRTETGKPNQSRQTTWGKNESKRWQTLANCKKERGKICVRLWRYSRVHTHGTHTKNPLTYTHKTHTHTHSRHRRPRRLRCSFRRIML